MKLLLALTLILSTLSVKAFYNPNRRLHILLHEVILKDKGGKALYHKAKEGGLDLLKFYCHNGTKDPEKACKKNKKYFICPDNQADLCFNFKYYNTTTDQELIDLMIDGLVWYTN